MVTLRKLSTLVALSGLFTLSAGSASALVLTLSSYGSVQDNITLGLNSGTTDTVTASPLYVGDHANNKSVYHVGYKFNLNDQDWSPLISEGATFTLKVEITGIDGLGWNSISLYHVPLHAPISVTNSIILGGELVKTVTTSGMKSGDFLEFDVTDQILKDIEHELDYTTFRFSQTVLVNNDNSARDALVLSATPTLTMPDSAVPEPAHFGAVFGLLTFAAVIWRRRRQVE